MAVKYIQASKWIWLWSKQNMTKRTSQPGLGQRNTLIKHPFVQLQHAVASNTHSCTFCTNLEAFFWEPRIRAFPQFLLPRRSWATAQEATNFYLFGTHLYTTVKTQDSYMGSCSRWRRRSFFPGLFFRSSSFHCKLMR